MIDVALLDAPAGSSDRDLGECESLHLAELAGFLHQRGLSTQRIEARLRNLPVTEAVTEVAACNPLIVSIWLQYRSLRYSIQFLTELCARRAGVLDQNPLLVVLEGNVAVFSTQALLQELPPSLPVALILGEAEEPLVALADECKRNDKREHVPDVCCRSAQDAGRTVIRSNGLMTLEHMPSPLRLASRYGSEEWVEIRSSRGCYHQCAFCSVNPFLHWTGRSSWRGYPLEMVVDQMSALYARGARRFYFVDDIFFGPGRQGQRRAHAFATLLQEVGLEVEWQIFCRTDNVDAALFENLRSCGLSTVNVGIESAAQAQLDRLGKQETLADTAGALLLLRSLGIRVIPSFILFDPYVELDELETTIRWGTANHFMMYLGPSCVIPFAGAPLTIRITEDGLLDNDQCLVRDYLPGVRMANTQVERLRTVWTQWRPWVDENFGGLATELAGAAYRFDMASGAARSAGELAHMYGLACRLKALEIDYILQCIDCIRANASPQQLTGLCNARLDEIALIAAQMHTASSRHILCRC